MISKKLIKVSEYYKFLISLKEDERFSIEEIEILESKFSSNIQDISRHTLEQIIQMQEYVGYIILPFYISMFFDNLMNTNFNNRSNNNHRYLILLSIVSVFSAIVFLTSSKAIQSVFANSISGFP